MLKLKLVVFILILNCSLFANINNFEVEAKKNTKILLNKNYEMLLINKKSLENYYVTNNFKPFWIDENVIKNIGLSLVEKIKNDPVFKPNTSKIFRLNEVINSINTLNKSNENYIENLVKIDFMLTELFDRYATFLSNGFVDWNIFEEKLAELEKEKEIKAHWEKFTLNKNPKLLIKKVIETNDLSGVL